MENTQEVIKRQLALSKPRQLIPYMKRGGDIDNIEGRPCFPLMHAKHACFHPRHWKHDQYIYKCMKGEVLRSTDK